MTAIVLIVICVAYIGLGIPDSLFGAAWPAMYDEFGVSSSYAGVVTSVIYLGTIVSSLLSARIIKLLKTPKVTALSTALTAVGLLGFSVSNNIAFLCLFAVPLGIGAGSIDTALNNYVAVHCKASFINFLHCFYGVGVSLSPFIMSLALQGDGGWRGGYRTVFYFQAGICALVFLVLPFWKKSNDSEKIEENARIVKIKDIIKIPLARSSLMIFMGSCTIEAICLVWGSTFLVDSKEISAGKAAQAITFYFIGLTIGRFLSGILAGKLPPKKIVVAGEVITLAAIIIVTVSNGVAMCTVGLFLIGLGNGPVFPNMTYLTPVNFGADVSQSFIGLQMAVSNLSFLLMPPLFGAIGQITGITVFSYFLLAAVLITLVSTVAMIRLSGDKNK